MARKSVAKDKRTTRKEPDDRQLAKKKLVGAKNARSNS